MESNYREDDIVEFFNDDGSSEFGLVISVNITDTISALVVSGFGSARRPQWIPTDQVRNHWKNLRRDRMNDIYLTREEIEHPYADIKTMIEDKRRKAEQMRKTLFAKITASPEVLAEKLVFPMWDGAFSWESTIIPTVKFSSRAEAIAATVAKLNALVESEVEDE